MNEQAGPSLRADNKAEVFQNASDHAGNCSLSIDDYTLIRSTKSGYLFIEEFKTLRDQWIRVAHGFILVYSVDSRISFERHENFRQGQARRPHIHDYWQQMQHDAARAGGFKSGWCCFSTSIWL